MKNPIALLVNDLHVDKNNIAEFEKNWNEALSVCQQKRVEDLVVGGDIFTTRSSQPLSVLLSVQHCLEKARSKGIYVTIAPGNHDLVDQEMTESYCHLYKHIDGVEVIDTYGSLDYAEISIGVIAYFPETGSFMNKLEELKEMFKHDEVKLKNVILYLHEGIHGGVGNMDIPGELPNNIFGEFKEVLVGHYHNYNHIDGTNVTYIGSSRQHNFGEDDYKGYTLVYEDGSWEHIPNNVNMKYCTVDIDYDKLDEIEDYFAYDDRGTFYARLRINVPSAKVDTVDRQKLLDMGFSKVELKTEKVSVLNAESTAINEKYDKAGIKKEYIRFCGDKCIDSQLGIDYLNK